MAQMNPEDFEALWNGVKERPLVRAAQPTPIQADLSLTGILNHYMAMAATHQSQGKISAQDYADLSAAVDALKAVLVRINDSALVADAAAQVQQKLQSKGS
jgi:hypothetical protein